MTAAIFDPVSTIPLACVTFAILYGKAGQREAGDFFVVRIEGKFGDAKRSYSLDFVRMRLKETSESSSMMVFLMMNLMKLGGTERGLSFELF